MGLQKQLPTMFLYAYCSMNSSLNFLKLAMIAGISSSGGNMVVRKWKTLQK